MSFLPIIRKFIIYLQEVKNYSPFTVKGYTRYLDDFQQFVSDLEPEELTIEHIWDFKNALTERGLSLRTQNLYLITIRSLLSFCFKNDISTLDCRKIDLAKFEYPKIEYLEFDELQRLFKAINIKTVQGLRDMAITQLLYSTGMRVGELSQLNFFNVDLKNRQFSIIGKGRKPRVVFLSPVAVTWIKKYLDTRKDTSNALFINYRNARKTENKSEQRRLSVTAIQRLIRLYGKKAKLEKEITPHTLRHTFATHLNMQGLDERSLQEMLGHKFITTTQLYLHRTNKYLQKLHTKFHPHFLKNEKERHYMN